MARTATTRKTNTTAQIESGPDTMQEQTSVMTGMMAGNPNQVVANLQDTLKSFSSLNFANGNVVKTMENVMTKTQKQYEEQAQKAFQGMGEAASWGKNHFDAMMKSSAIWAKGCEEMMKTCMSMAQSSMEKSQGVGSELMACKTLNELAETNNKLAQKSFDDLITTTTKLSEMAMKVANEASEPLNQVMNQAMDKASKAA